MGVHPPQNGGIGYDPWPFMAGTCCLLAFTRDPYIIHLNIALHMVVSLYFGGKGHVSNGQNDLLRSAVHVPGFGDSSWVVPVRAGRSQQVLIELAAVAIALRASGMSGMGQAPFYASLHLRLAPAKTSQSNHYRLKWRCTYPKWYPNGFDPQCIQGPSIASNHTPIVYIHLELSLCFKWLSFFEGTPFWIVFNGHQRETEAHFGGCNS